MNLHFNDLEWYPLAALAGLLAEVDGVVATISSPTGYYQGARISEDDNPDLREADSIVFTHNGNRITLGIEDITTITIS